jgi:hypothetical protein
MVTDQALTFPFSMRRTWWSVIPSRRAMSWSDSVLMSSSQTFSSTCGPGATWTMTPPWPFFAKSLSKLQLRGLALILDSSTTQIAFVHLVT